MKIFSLAQSFRTLLPKSLVKSSKDQPPLENLIRRFFKRDGVTLLDDIAGNDGTIVGGHTIPANEFIDDSSFYVRLFTTGQVTAEYAFFDKSDATIWKNDVRTSGHYDAGNPGDWHSSELDQQFIYDNIEDAYKYQVWVKDNTDIFLYSAPLTGVDVCKAKHYVDLGEVYSGLLPIGLLLCGTDTLEI